MSYGLFTDRTACAIFESLKEVKEILEGEIGEWLSVQETYCPESVISLKHALALLEQTRMKYLAPPDLLNSLTGTAPSTESDEPDTA